MPAGIRRRANVKLTPSGLGVVDRDPSCRGEPRGPGPANL